MSTLTIELTDELSARLEAVSAALKVRPAEWAKEVVVNALPPAAVGATDTNGWPIGYFEKYVGCLADDDWEPPTDPPPEPTLEP